MFVYEKLLLSANLSGKRGNAPQQRTTYPRVQ